MILAALAITCLTSLPSLEDKATAQDAVNSGQYRAGSVWYDGTGTNAFGIGVTNALPFVIINGTTTYAYSGSTNFNLTNGAVHSITVKNGLVTAVQ